MKEKGRQLYNISDTNADTDTATDSWQTDQISIILNDVYIC